MQHTWPNLRVRGYVGRLRGYLSTNGGRIVPPSLTLALLLGDYHRLTTRVRVRYIVHPGLDVLIVFIAMGSPALQWGARFSSCWWYTRYIQRGFLVHIRSHCHERQASFHLIHARSNVIATIYLPPATPSFSFALVASSSTWGENCIVVSLCTLQYCPRSLIHFASLWTCQLVETWQALSTGNSLRANGQKILPIMFRNFFSRVCLFEIWNVALQLCDFLGVRILMPRCESNTSCITSCHQCETSTDNCCAQLSHRWMGVRREGGRSVSRRDEILHTRLEARGRTLPWNASKCRNHSWCVELPVFDSSSTS